MVGPLYTAGCPGAVQRGGTLLAHPLSIPLFAHPSTYPHYLPIIVYATTLTLAAAAAQVYVGYQRELRERNALDLADLLLSLHALLRRDQRVLSRLRIRYRYLLVDEAQDLNPIQLAVAGMLSAGGRVTAVGDDDQAIYGWRGGEPWTLDAFHQL
jgi:superfamily I DNA/RNA helicase